MDIPGASAVRPIAYCRPMEVQGGSCLLPANPKNAHTTSSGQYGVGEGGWADEYHVAISLEVAPTGYRAPNCSDFPQHTVLLQKENCYFDPKGSKARPYGLKEGPTRCVYRDRVDVLGRFCCPMQQLESALKTGRPRRPGCCEARMHNIPHRSGKPQRPTHIGLG